MSRRAAQLPERGIALLHLLDAGAAWGRASSEERLLAGAEESEALRAAALEYARALGWTPPRAAGGGK